MARSSSSWWPWVQRNLDARGWLPADLARAIRREFGRGPDESVIGRWRNRGATPTRESVRLVAQVFDRDIREALIAAGWITAQQIGAEWLDPRNVDLSRVPDEVLLDEVHERMARKRDRHRRRATARPARSAGAPTANRTTLAPTSSVPDSTTVAIYPRQAETAPPSSGEGEGAAGVTAGNGGHG